MKNLLQNQAVVGVLALVAMVVVFINIIMPLTGGGGFVSSKVGELLDSSPVQSAKEILVSKEVQPLDYSLIGWTETPIRDPFKPVEFLDTGKEVAGEKVFDNPVPAHEVLSLLGIVVQPDFRLAMINKSIVKEGDTIGGYRVVSIKPGVVSVSGPLGRENISFSNSGFTADSKNKGAKHGGTLKREQ